MPVGLEDVPHAPVSQVGAKLLGQFRQDRDIAALAALGLVDQDHLLLEEEVLDAHAAKLRYPGAGCEERLDEQAVLAAILIRFTDQPLLFLFREALYNAFTRLNPLNSKGFSPSFETYLVWS